jgi:UDP-N-acetylmuramyl tripeptide synthase
MNNFIFFIGYIVSWISKAFGFGAGATWPGEIALRIDPHILSKFLPKINKGIIIVAGTNGKTTTSLMIKKIFTDQGFTVLHNASGANLLNGIVSSFLSESRDSYDYAVFEVDENALPGVLRHVTMSKGQKLIIVLLNLFRDQLDRYGEVDTIARNWLTTLKKLDKETTVLINGDDPHLAFIGKQINNRHSREGGNLSGKTWIPAQDRNDNKNQNIFYFGLGDPHYYLPKMQHATDTIFCPSCGNRLTFIGVYFSHLGEWSCSKCSFTHPSLSIKASQVESPMEGTYNIYNTLAATIASKQLGISDTVISNSISTFVPAFGRMEQITVDSKNITILLSKNPTGFNESLRTVLSSKSKGPLLLLLNDRIPDGTDVSWIWDVDMEQLDGYRYPIIVSGDRYLDMAVRLKYGLEKMPNDKCQMINKSLDEAVKRFVSEIKEDEAGWILATYSAMLDVRKILTGKKIL